MSRQKYHRPYKGPWKGAWNDPWGSTYMAPLWVVVFFMGHEEAHELMGLKDFEGWLFSGIPMAHSRFYGSYTPSWWGSLPRVFKIQLDRTVYGPWTPSRALESFMVLDPNFPPYTALSTMAFHGLYNLVLTVQGLLESFAAEKVFFDISFPTLLSDFPTLKVYNSSTHFLPRLSPLEVYIVLFSPKCHFWMDSIFNLHLWNPKQILKVQFGLGILISSAGEAIPL